MAQKSTKHAEVKTVSASLDGGLNLHDSPSSIGDNQMIECMNFYYADKGATLTTRNGVKRVIQFGNTQTFSGGGTAGPHFYIKGA